MKVNLILYKKIQRRQFNKSRTLKYLNIMLYQAFRIEIKKLN